MESWSRDVLTEDMEVSLWQSHEFTNHAYFRVVDEVTLKNAHRKSLSQQKPSAFASQDAVTPKDEELRACEARLLGLGERRVPFPLVWPSSAESMPALPGLSYLFNKDNLSETVLHRFLDRRVHVLNALYASTREDMAHTSQAHISNRFSTTKNPIGYKKDASKIPASLRWALMSLFTLIDSVSTIDSRLKMKTIQHLVTILQESEPFAFSYEAPETIDEMVALLKSATDEEKATEGKSGLVTSALIGVALNRGKLRYILEAALPLLDEKSVIDGKTIHIEPYLRSLTEYFDGVKGMDGLTESAYLERWCHHPLPKSDAIIAKGKRYPMHGYGSITSGGDYLYAHTSAGLFKIGAGTKGTIQGHLYKFMPNYRTHREGWLAFCQGKLFFRGSDMDSSVLGVCIDPNTLLELGMVPYVSQGVDSRPLPGRLAHLITDGNYLYILREEDRKRHVFVLDQLLVSDTARNNTVPTIAHVRHITLPCGWTQFPLNRKADKSPEELRSPYSYYAGQRIDAKDTVNKWCSGSVLQVTPSRVLVTYDDWTAKWDEWIEIDSARLAPAGTHVDGPTGASSSKKGKKAKAAVKPPEWYFEEEKVVPSAQPREVPFTPGMSFTSNSARSNMHRMLMSPSPFNSAMLSPRHTLSFPSLELDEFSLSGPLPATTTATEPGDEFSLGDAPQSSAEVSNDANNSPPASLPSEPHMYYRGLVNQLEQHLWEVEGAPALPVSGMPPTALDQSSAVEGKGEYDRKGLNDTVGLNSTTRTGGLLSPRSGDVGQAEETVVWRKYSSAIAQRLETAYNSGQHGMLSFRMNRRDYVFNVDEMIQIDKMTCRATKLMRKVPSPDRFQYLEDVQMFITNGTQLTVILPCPGGMFNPKYAQVQRLFFFPSIDDQTPVPEPEGPTSLAKYGKDVNMPFQQETQASSACYDAFNNKVWVFSPDSACLTSWNQPTFHSTLSALTRTKFKLRDVVRSDGEDTLLGAVDMLFDHVVKGIDVWASENTTQEQVTVCIDLHPDTFQRLQMILRRCCDTISRIKRLESVNQKQVTVLARYLLISMSTLNMLIANLNALVTRPRSEDRPAMLACLPAIRQSLEEFSNLFPLKLASEDNSLSDVLSFLASNEVESSICSLSSGALAAAFSLFCDNATRMAALITGSPSASAIGGHDYLLELIARSDHLSFLFAHADGDYDPLMNVLEFLLTAVTMRPLGESGRISSPLRLLSKLQRFMLSLLAPQDSAAYPLWEVFHKYCVDALTAASYTVELCLKKGGSAEQVEAGLKMSTVGVIIPPLFAFLSLAHSSVKISLLQSGLFTFIESIDKLFHALWSDKKLSSFDFLHFPQSTDFRSKVIESKHPYSEGIVEREVKIPGAVGVAIEYDPRCSSNGSNDALKVSQSQPRWQLASSGKQSGSSWPREMVKRPGNAVSFYFNVEKTDKKSKKDRYGFRCIVHGFVPVTPPGHDVFPWLLDIETSCTLAIASLLRTTTIVTPYPRSSSFNIAALSYDILFDASLQYFRVTEDSQDKPRICSFRSMDESKTTAIAAFYGNGDEQDDVQLIDEEEDALASCHFSIFDGGLYSNASGFSPLEIESLAQDSNPVTLMGAQRALIAGIRNSDTEAFLMDLVKCTEDAMRMCTAFRRLIPGRPMIVKSQRRAMEQMELSLFAALLRHFCLEKEGYAIFAQFVMNADDDIPDETKVLMRSEEMVHIWKAMYKFESRLTSMAQMSKRYGFMIDLLREELEDVDVSDWGKLEAAVLKSHNPSVLHGFCKLFDLSFDTDNVPKSLEPLLKLVQSHLQGGERNHESESKHNCSSSSMMDNLLRGSRHRSSSVDVDKTTMLTVFALRAQKIACFLLGFQHCSSLEVAKDRIFSWFKPSMSFTRSPARIARVLRKRHHRLLARAQAFRMTTQMLRGAREPIMKHLIAISLETKTSYHRAVDGAQLSLRKQLVTDASVLVSELTQAASTGSFNADTGVKMLQVHLQEFDFNNTMDAELLTRANVYDSLLTLAKALYDANSISDATDTNAGKHSSFCSFAYTGKNFVLQRIYECHTCGLINGDCCCRACIKTCHKGHDVSFKRMGPAFCDCALFKAGFCQCQGSTETREYIVQMGLLAQDCITIQRKLLLASLDAPISAALKTQILSIFLTRVVAEVTRFDEGKFTKITDRLFLDDLLYHCYLLRSHFEVLVSESISLLQSLFQALTILQQSAHGNAQRVAMYLLAHLCTLLTPRDAMPGNEAGVKEYVLTLIETIGDGIHEFSHQRDTLPKAAPNSESEANITKRVDELARVVSTEEGEYETVFHLPSGSGIGNVVSKFVELFAADVRVYSELAKIERASTKLQTKIGEVESAAQGVDGKQVLIPSSTQLEMSGADSQMLVADLVAEAKNPSAGRPEHMRPRMPSVDPMEFLNDAHVQQTRIRERRLWDEQDELRTLLEPNNLFEETQKRLGKDEKKLDRTWIEQFRQALTVKRRAVVLTGTKETCRQLAGRIAKRGYVCSVEKCKPDIGAVLNHNLLDQLRDAVPPSFQGPKQAYASLNADDVPHPSALYGVGGEQSVSMVNQLILFVRFLAGEVSTEGWAAIVQQCIVECMDALALECIDKIKSNVKHNALLPRVLGVSLLVSAQPLHAALHVGGSVIVYTGEELSAENRVHGKFSSGSSKLRRESQWLPGIVVRLEDGSSTLDVMFADGLSTVHRSAVVGSVPVQLEHDRFIRSLGLPVVAKLTQGVCGLLAALMQLHTHAAYSNATTLACDSLKLLDTSSLNTDGKSSESAPVSPVRSSSDIRISAEKIWKFSLLQFALIDGLAGLTSTPQVVCFLRMPEHVNFLSSLVYFASSSQEKHRTSVLYENWLRGITRLSDVALHTMTQAGAATQVSDQSRSVTGLVPTGFDSTRVSRCVFWGGQRGSYATAMFTGASLPVASEGRKSARHAKKKEHLPVTLIANSPIPICRPEVKGPMKSGEVGSPEFYFEVEIISVGEGKGNVTVGICPSRYSLYSKASAAGWCVGSMVFCSDNGHIGHYQNQSKSPEDLGVRDLLDVKDSVNKWEAAVVIDENGDALLVHYVDWDSRYDEWLSRDSDRIAGYRTHTPGEVGQFFYEPYHDKGFKSGDVVGCGVNFATQSIFFTKNGVHLGTAYTSLPEPHTGLYPGVCVSNPKSVVRFNFGGPKKPFVYMWQRPKWPTRDLKQPRTEKPFSFSEIASAFSPHPMFLGGEPSDTPELKVPEEPISEDASPHVLTDVLTTESQLVLEDVSSSSSPVYFAPSTMHPSVDSSSSGTDSDASESHDETDSDLAMSRSLSIPQTTADGKSRFSDEAQSQRIALATEVLESGVLPGATLNEIRDSLLMNGDDVERTVARFQLTHDPFSAQAHLYRHGGGNSRHSGIESKIATLPLNPDDSIYATSSEDVQVQESDEIAMGLMGDVSRGGMDASASASADSRAFLSSLGNLGSALSGGDDNRMDSVGLIQLLEGLRVLSVGSLAHAVMVLGDNSNGGQIPEDAIRIPVSSLAEGLLGGGSNARSEPLFADDAIRPGLRVRISPNAKSGTLARIGTNVQELPSWVVPMDATLGVTGVVLAVKNEHNLALVEFFNPESGVRVAWWYQFSVLVRPVMRYQNAHLSLTTRSAVFPFLTQIQDLMSYASLRTVLQNIFATPVGVNVVGSISNNICAGQVTASSGFASDLIELWSYEKFMHRVRLPGWDSFFMSSTLLPETPLPLLLLNKVLKVFLEDSKKVSFTLQPNTKESIDPVLVESQFFNFAGASFLAFQLHLRRSLPVGYTVEIHEADTNGNALSLLRIIKGSDAKQGNFVLMASMIVMRCLYSESTAKRIKRGASSDTKINFTMNVSPIHSDILYAGRMISHLVATRQEVVRAAEVKRVVESEVAIEQQSRVQYTVASLVSTIFNMLQTMQFPVFLFSELSSALVNLVEMMPLKKSPDLALNMWRHGLFEQMTELYRMERARSEREFKENVGKRGKSPGLEKITLFTPRLTSLVELFAACHCYKYRVLTDIDTSPLPESQRESKTVTPHIGTPRTVPSSPDVQTLNVPPPSLATSTENSTRRVWSSQNSNPVSRTPSSYLEVPQDLDAPVSTEISRTPRPLSPEQNVSMDFNNIEETGLPDVLSHETLLRDLTPNTQTASSDQPNVQQLNELMNSRSLFDDLAANLVENVAFTAPGQLEAQLTVANYRPAAPVSKIRSMNISIGRYSWLDCYCAAVYNLRSLTDSKETLIHFPRTLRHRLKQPVDCVGKTHLNLDCYEQLTELVQLVGQHANVVPRKVSRNDMKTHGMPVLEQMRFAQLAKLDAMELYAHVIFLQNLNVLLEEIMSLINFSTVDVEGSVAQVLVRCRRVIFTPIKIAFMVNIFTLTATHKDSRDAPRVRLDRIRAGAVLDRDAQRALNAKQSRTFDAKVRDTIIGQAMAQLANVRNDKLKPTAPRGAAPHVALNCSFTNEKVLGQAGPYRAFYTDFSRELLESRGFNDPYPLNLFVPTQNNLHSLGEGRTNFTPNPSCTSLSHLHLYEFIGKLIGMAMRTKVLLALDFSSIIWKFLVRESLSVKDLERTDLNLVWGVLEKLRMCKTEEEFETLFGIEGENAPLSFPVLRSDQQRMQSPFEEAKQHVVTTAVTFQTAQRYAAELEYMRLHECDSQLNALRRGLTSIIPTDLLQLYSWQELSNLVCGVGEIDLALLMRHTEYGPGLSATSPTIVDFWQVLTGFTQAQRKRFISFTYGQERLPATDEGFNSYPRIRMLIKQSNHAKGAQADGALPHADTCFFNLTLPPYSSLEVMRQRLLTVVELDWGMSGDDDLSDMMQIQQQRVNPPPSTELPSLRRRNHNDEDLD